MPQWVETIGRWSQEQCQQPPIGPNGDFLNLEGGGPTDRSLPVVIRCVRRQGAQVRTTYDQLLVTNTIAQVNTARLRRLDQDRDQTQNHTKALRRELDAALAEIGTLRRNQAALERRLSEVESQISEPKILNIKRSP